MRLADKIAVVTGGGGGIGKAIAAAYVREGAFVVVTDKDREKAQATVAGIGGDRTEAMVLDAADPDAAQAVMRGIAHKYDRLDILVYAAGCSLRAHTLDIAPEDWERIIRVNLSGAFYCAQAAARAMRLHASGSIILVSSQLAEVARRDGAPYVASKGGLRALAKALAVDLAVYRIRVNCLGPGVTRTPMTQARYADPEVRAEWERRIPLGRVAEPDDVAGAAVFLASDDAAYVTGTSVYVDGGYLAW